MAKKNIRQKNYWAEKKGEINKNRAEKYIKQKNYWAEKKGKINKNRAEKSGKSAPTTDGENRSDGDLLPSKAIPSKVVLPVKVRYSRAYNSPFSQYPTLL